MKLHSRHQNIATFVALLLMAGTSSVFAQGGGHGGSGGGSTGGATIYFINGAGGGYNTNYTWTMNSDGTNVNQLGFFGLFSVPSRASHNSHTWFLTTLTIGNEFYPDGVSRRSEVFAIRDDYDGVLNNNSETRVQLTDNPNLQPAFGWFQGMHWTPGDLKISFKGRRWDGAVPVEGGLYTADLVYGTDGNITGIAAQPTAPAVAFALDGNGWPAVGRFSWGSSNTQVAYIDSPETGIWIANLSTGTRTRIYTGYAGYLDWSQDGSKFVFGSGSVRTMKSNGSTVKTIIAPKYVNGAYLSGFAHAYFNPAGTHVTCVGIVNLPGGGQDNDVIRATVTGGSVTNLTNTPSLVELPISWR